MENGIVVQLKAMQRALARIEAFLSADEGWREYQSKFQQWPDLPESEAVAKAKLPASLTQVLEDNRLFLARRKILEVIDLLVDLAEDPRGYAPPLISDNEAEEAHSRATLAPNNPLNQRIANLEKMIANVIMPDLRRPPIDVINRSQRQRLGATDQSGDRAPSEAVPSDEHKNQSSGSASLSEILLQLETQSSKLSIESKDAQICPPPVPKRAVEITSAVSKSRFLEALTGRLKE
ncbi:MAG: hypothetical protein ACR2PG_01060 [Hyphomicrobiaceae bacterium]